MKKIEKIFEKMNMVEITSPVQKKNGTRHYMDQQTGQEYIFRQFSSPRFRYWSDKTNSWQDYRLFEPTGSTVQEDMREAIPYIVNRKVKHVQNRAVNAFEIASSVASRLIF